MDFTLHTKPSQKGHEYFVDLQLKTGIMLKKLNGETYELKVQTPTLIQIWSVCCGGDALQWADQRFVESQYSSHGLRVVSINFENGKNAAQQLSMVNDFFQSKPRPSEFYVDSLGYCIDDLPFKGFPTYILVDGKGKIIFRTAGKSEEGKKLLISEIENLLEQHD
jgi:hypothetical protein